MLGSLTLRNFLVIFRYVSHEILFIAALEVDMRLINYRVMYELQNFPNGAPVRATLNVQYEQECKLGVIPNLLSLNLKALDI